MQMVVRKGISPIIATLLLIAIAIAAGIIVYVFVGTLTGNLTQSGGQQVSEGVSEDTFNFATLTAPKLTLRNFGGSSVTLNAVFYDGNLCQAGGVTCTAAVMFSDLAPNGNCADTGGALPVTCTAGQYTTMTLTVTAATSGTSHLVRMVTATGGTFSYAIIAGRSG